MSATRYEEVWKDGKIYRRPVAPVAPPRTGRTFDSDGYYVQDNSLRLTWKWHIFGYCVSGPLYFIVGPLICLGYAYNKPERDWTPLLHWALVTFIPLCIAIVAAALFLH